MLHPTVFVLRPFDFDLVTKAYKVRGRWPHCAAAPFAPTPCGAQPRLGQGYAPTPPERLRPFRASLRGLVTVDRARTGGGGARRARKHPAGDRGHRGHRGRGGLLAGRSSPAGSGGIPRRPELVPARTGLRLRTRGCGAEPSNSSRAASPHPRRVRRRPSGGADDPGNHPPTQWPAVGSGDPAIDQLCGAC